MQKLDHNIGFWEKRQFFRRKLAKNAENCDRNIDPGNSGFGEMPAHIWYAIQIGFQGEKVGWGKTD
jgi:hypothetical protein